MIPVSSESLPRRAPIAAGGPSLGRGSSVLVGLPEPEFLLEGGDAVPERGLAQLGCIRIQLLDPHELLCSRVLSGAVRLHRRHRISPFGLVCVAIGDRMVFR
jgi:hypothetical protein